MLPSEDSRGRVVFLLGAGASVDAGCPAVEALVSSFRERLKAEGSSKEGSAFADIVDLLSSSEPVQTGRIRLDVELLLSTIRQLSERESSALHPFVRQWNRAVARHAGSLQVLLTLLEEHIRAECTVQPEKVRYLWPIGDLVEQYGSLDVFSLNYDAAIEVMCQQREISYTDGFDLYWNPVHFESPMYRLRLFKLHGSLLWYETPGPSRHVVKIPIKPAAAGRLQFFTDEAVSPVLMYPAFVKRQHVDPYATLMAYFRAALGRANVLVAVGCSFRDQYLKEVLVEKLVENDGLHVVIVDPRAWQVVAESDNNLDPVWQFVSAADRLSFFHDTAANALAGHRLLEHIRATEALPQTKMNYQQAVLGGANEAARNHAAAQYIDNLVRVRNVGALTAIASKSLPMAALYDMLRARVLNGSVGEAGDLVPMGLLILRFGSESDRTAVGAWLQDTVQWLIEYVVWESNRRCFTTLLQASQRVVDATNPSQFFKDHAERIRHFLHEFDLWLKCFAFVVPPEVTRTAAKIAADVRLCLDYFQRAAEAGRWVPFRAGLKGETYFLRTPDDDVLRKLGERMDDRWRIPRSLVEAIGEPTLLGISLV